MHISLTHTLLYHPLLFLSLSHNTTSFNTISLSLSLTNIHSINPIIQPSFTYLYHSQDNKVSLYYLISLSFLDIIKWPKQFENTASFVSSFPGDDDGGAT